MVRLTKHQCLLNAIAEHDLVKFTKSQTSFIDTIIRGVGCIYYEMVTGRPLFAGQNVQEQLHHIFKKRGTPTEETWPDIKSHAKFLEYK